MKKESYQKLTIIGIFAMAMAFLETVIVIYLRKLYYPPGFNFPLAPLIETYILNIEWVREFFTIVMLACIGLIAGKTHYEKFAYFLYSFAIWDIFYYIWLKVILNWPPSLLTWDLLFLIPWPWAGPVLAPLIVSFTMISLGWRIIAIGDQGRKVKITKKEWMLLVLGSLLILYTFLYDYGNLIISRGFLPEFFTLASSGEFQQIVGNYVPSYYPWWLFILGEILILLAIFSFSRTRTGSFKKSLSLNKKSKRG